MDEEEKMEIENKEQIIRRRKEIEKELLEMLKETKSDFGLEDIKEIIYNENGQDSLTDIIIRGRIYKQRGAGSSRIRPKIYSRKHH